MTTYWRKIQIGEYFRTPGDWFWRNSWGYLVDCGEQEMSAALLRKGLELLGSDATDNNSSGFKKRAGGSSHPVALSSHKTGMNKQRRRLKQQGQPQNQRASAKNRVIKSAVEEYKKRTAEDHLAQNLKYMLGSQAVTSKVSCSKILSQHCGRKAKDQCVKKQKRVQEVSLFTDKDFQKFQKEYFGTR